VTQPGLRAVTFILAAEPPPATGNIPYDLSIEVAWDWTDRSPGAIRITGQFVPAHTQLGPAYLSGFACFSCGALGNDGVPASTPIPSKEHRASKSNCPARLPSFMST
jgi:hypothetical protein